ncbi:MAG: polyprenol phosphomannose-dependent alpha 1,6 mannosyltransferase MptB [Solirubrobacterales bacterium]|nr:polyprenol phosphomannose-dependent alpha 1,6 mannosyltransferase MptB [Solirubrobacterales bacterium]
MSVRSPLGATAPQSGYQLEAPPTARRVAVREPLGAVALAVLVAGGLLIALSAAGTDALLPMSVRPVPSSLAGPFGGSGIDIGGVGVMITLAAMFVSYAYTVHRAGRLSPGAVLMSIAALEALMLIAPPLLSTDVFSYSAYGRMGTLYGANPYLHGPYAIALDPLYPFIGAKWVTTPSVYGPLFTALSYVLAPLSIASSVLAYKTIAVVSSLATVTFVWNAARWRGVDPVRAVALVGLNPLLLVYGVGGAHNDLLMLAASTAGVYALIQRRNRAGGGLLAAATWVKLTGALLVPFALAGEPGTRKRGWREIASGAALVTAAVAVVSAILFGTGPLHLPATIAQSQRDGDWHSIPGFIANVVGWPTVGHVVGIVLACAFVLVCAWLLVRVKRDQIDWIEGAGWATLAMLITASSLLPWYVAWLLPLAALSANGRLWRSALVLSGVILAIQLVGYIPHVGTPM